MKKYIKNYLRYFDLGEQDLLTCECCGKQGRVDGEGFDIHHINGRIGINKDDVHMLICCCRKCHDFIHAGKITKEGMQLIHNYFLQGHRIQFIK